MTTKHKTTPGEIMLKARLATHQIIAARKQAVSQYDAALRQLIDLDRVLSTPESVAQPEMFDADTVLTPDLMDLIETPLKRFG